MLVPFKDRGCSFGQRVQVYLNLHKTEDDGTKWYSLRDKATGKVIAHADQVHLTQVKFIVSEAGRQRVLKERRKNVHAVVEGNLVDQNLTKHKPVRYNPYYNENFNQDGKAIHTAPACSLGSNGKVTV